MTQYYDWEQGWGEYLLHGRPLWLRVLLDAIATDGCKADSTIDAEYVDED